MEELQEEQFLQHLISSIVKNPDDIRITRTVDDMGVLLSLRVAKSDMGLLIGKAGITASAIKLIVKLVGYKNGAKVSVKIDEPERA